MIPGMLSSVFAQDFPTTIEREHRHVFDRRKI